MKHRVDFYFDVVSPYSYLAFKRLINLQKTYSFDLILKPTLFGGVMSESENTFPAKNPRKAQFMELDLQRSFQPLGIKLKIPSTFPTNTILALRSLLQISEEKYMQIRCAEELWTLYWVQNQDISNPDVVRRALMICGYDAKAADSILENCQSDGIKMELKRNSSIVAKYGGFGLPVMIVKNSLTNETEFFYGSDRFNHIRQFLQINSKI